MQEAIDNITRNQVVKEILAVLNKHNLPTNTIVSDCTHNLLKVVSCQHQHANEPKR